MVKLFKPITSALSKLTSSISQSSTINGWDLYGRVPFDDFIFKTSNLIDNNLLRRSMTEAILEEIPYALPHFRRRKRIYEIMTSLKSLSVLVIGFFLFGFVLKLILQAGLRKIRSQSGAPISAINKKSNRKGKQIEGMGEGFYDMEVYDDDSDNKDNDKDKDDLFD
uniref:Uncharacterized protein n=1 Tax=Chromulina nebulosa TaxID=96789 RepID=A0A7S0XDE2_9STRA|mmetsp:Transcript_3323/g.2954  ORF Transcript_3323/g.2954 Transcript_3323/m.2954 type:complete len:166 (+) Transcript_3323:71-568(+)